MIDINDKQETKREAVASGKIFLRPKTLTAIKEDSVKKGDVFETARVAGMTAVKQTHLLIPYCHQIPIGFIGFEFLIEKDHVLSRCTVKTMAKTGVEMESIVGITVALSTIWDMVKYLEKDEEGQYCYTKMSDIKVEKKTKR